MKGCYFHTNLPPVTKLRSTHKKRTNPNLILFCTCLCIDFEPLACLINSWDTQMSPDNWQHMEHHLPALSDTMEKANLFQQKIFSWLPNTIPTVVYCDIPRLIVTDSPKTAHWWVMSWPWQLYLGGTNPTRWVPVKRIIWKHWNATYGLSLASSLMRDYAC